VELNGEGERFGGRDDEVFGEGQDFGEGVAFDGFPGFEPAGEGVLSGLRDGAQGEEAEGEKGGGGGCPETVRWVGDGLREILVPHGIGRLLDGGLDEAL
jgi:hypothetical protein